MFYCRGVKKRTICTDVCDKGISPFFFTLLLFFVLGGDVADRPDTTCQGWTEPGGPRVRERSSRGMSASRRLPPSQPDGASRGAVEETTAALAPRKEETLRVKLGRPTWRPPKERRARPSDSLL